MTDERKNMLFLKEYSEKYGVPKVVNDMGEVRKTRPCESIVFPNGWVASVVKNTNNSEINTEYSVAMCDYDGYFNWLILDAFGAKDGCFYCNTELEIVIACEVIRNLPTLDVIRTSWDNDRKGCA